MVTTFKTAVTYKKWQWPNSAHITYAWHALLLWHMYLHTYKYKYIQLCKLTPKQHHFGLLDYSGPNQAELTYSSIIATIILLNTKQKKKRMLTFKVVNKTVTNTLHGTNFQMSNIRNRLV